MNKVLKILLRVLITTCLMFGLAICLSCSDLFGHQQTIQDAIATPPLMTVTVICSVVLLLVSLFCLKRFGRLAIYGLIVSIFSLLTLLLPTV